MMKYTSEAIVELQEEIEKYCATKVELMAFREETAINFGKVHAAIIATHVEIAKLEVKLAAMEARIVKWSIATMFAVAGVAFGVARFVH